MHKITVPFVSTGFLFSVVLGFSAFSTAEEVKVPVGQQAAESQTVKRPQKGARKESVEAKFGQPKDWTDPVGDPPISRWEYEQFTVFFEYDRVIHSVLKQTKTQ